ncbi:hypothetical protein [Actinophytocola glycyrrhizae]|uniref:Uncharacterized protein n=1 Tax=Actinophytocola glycyrrhizae TaxID=2044873 RepID=A0ABV9RYG3_9PSEU
MDVVEILDALAEQGVVAILKADGERQHDRWTFVASGKVLGDDFVRTDAASAAACLKNVVPRLQALGLTVPTGGSPRP